MQLLHRFRHPSEKGDEPMKTASGLKSGNVAPLTAILL